MAIPQAAGSWGQAKGIYRFLANQRVRPPPCSRFSPVTPPSSAWSQTTVAVVQDTTSR